jgi:hypothetical protein
MKDYFSINQKRLNDLLKNIDALSWFIEKNIILLLTLLQEKNKSKLEVEKIKLNSLNQ